MHLLSDHPDTASYDKIVMIHIGFADQTQKNPFAHEYDSQREENLPRKNTTDLYEQHSLLDTRGTRFFMNRLRYRTVEMLWYFSFLQVCML